MPKHHVAIELIGNAGRLLRELDRSSSGVRKFGGAVKSEFRALGNLATSLQGKLAGIGISLGAVQITKQAALLDKKLIQIGQTADVDKLKVRELRKELYGMGRQGGQQIDQLTEGFNNLIQSGQSFKAALESTRGINIASAVTGAGGGVLAGGLTVGATAFNIDLEKPGKALELLDKMVVAGRLGNAELENLAAIFSRVGVNAASAGMSFDKTMAFIETLSLVERSPERLATLADSTLRLFTNLRYMANAQKATGVAFFDQKTGERRDPVAVLKDIRTEYGKLDTEIKRAGFIQKAFGEADLDTIKGMRTLLGGAFLETTEDFEARIGQAAGTLDRDFAAATDNLIDQAGRLRETLREAADAFTKPMRDTLADWIKYGLDQKKLSGGQIIAGGAGLALGGAALARYGPKALGALAKRFGTDAAGITAGLAVEAATGVQPVFVTNWPAGGIGGKVPAEAGNAVRKHGWKLGILGRLGVGGAMMWGMNEGFHALGLKNSTIESIGQNYDQSSESYGRLLEVLSGQRDWHTGETRQPIEINNQISIDRNDRVTSETSDMNTHVTTELKRARFN